MVNELVPFNAQSAVARAMMMKEIVMAVAGGVLRDGVDFGIIPGTGKPGEEKKVLMKPGAERLCTAFMLYPVFTVVSQVEDWHQGIFFYRYECALMHRETGECWGRGIGSCNSQENKYGWRWTSAPPSHIDPSTLMTRSGTIQELKFAIDAAKTEGEYSKKQEYWDMWNNAIADGTARRLPDNKSRKSKAGKVMETWEMGGIEYRVPNPDIFDLVNTIDKMGQKRALIAATLIAVNASEFFTQDVDDFDPAVFGIKAPAITVEPMPETPQNAPHWSTGEGVMDALHKWAADNHKATPAHVNAAIRSTGKTLLDLSKSDVMAAVKTHMSKQAVD